MSDTPPMNNDVPLPLNGRDRTPELTSKREKRSRDDEDDDRSRSGRRRHEHDDGRERERERERDRDRERERDRDRDSRDGGDYDRERERRHRRHRDDGKDDEERRERRRRHHHDDETEEEREERRRRRREREERHRDRNDRDRSRESHRSHPRESNRDREHRDRDRGGGGEREREKEGDAAYREMSREEKEREREKRDREMQEERREAARMREERYGQMDRDRDADRRRYRDDRPPPPPPGYHDRRDSLPPRPPMSPPPPRRRRDSPSYDAGPGPGPRGPGGLGQDRGSRHNDAAPKDPVVQLLEEVDREQRSVFVSQIASRLTSQDLGDFFIDMLGAGSVRDARVVTDKVSRRSKGIGYVELDSVDHLNKALSLSGTIVMGIPISIKQTESERNREGQMEAAMAKLQSGEWEREEKQRERQRPQRQFVPRFPPLSTGLAIPPGLDVDAHKHASIPYHRLFITSLAYSLTPNDVSQVFEAFGPIEFVDLHQDHHGQSKGSAYVQFQNLSSAQMALDAMDNFELAGRHIRVTAVEDRSQAKDVIEDTSYAPRMDANARRDLMQKLARTEAPPAPPSRPPPPPVEHVQPTPFLLVGNMFNPDDETERNWDLDMAEDVKGEVENKYGPVKRIKVDKMSRGDVYIEFDSEASATRAQKGLGGRFFGGRQLTAAYITEGILKAHF